jgi:ribulose-phosphate 3-epimerase
MGAMVGVAIKPNTTESLLRAIMNKVDLILVMTVEPGYGAQKLIPYTINKVENVRKMGFKGLLEVDGGINLENAEILRKAGANVIVSGTALFGATYVYEAAKIIKGI